MCKKVSPSCALCIDARGRVDVCCRELSGAVAGLRPGLCL